MEIPRYKEFPHKKADRLGLAKPHIYWCKKYNGWHAYRPANVKDFRATDFCLEQDARWTPRGIGHE